MLDNYHLTSLYLYSKYYLKFLDSVLWIDKE